MHEPLLMRRAITLFALVIVSVWVWTLPVGTGAATAQYVRVSFLDVGQGDAILIESPSGKQMLVDGGRNTSVLRALQQEVSFFDRHLDYVVATHPDQDHIGGLIDVLARYDIDTVITTDNQADTATASTFQTAIATEEATVELAKRGQFYDLGSGVIVEVLWPEQSVMNEERNASSIVLQVRYGDIEFMLTGDAPKRIEEYLVLAYGEHLESEVLKAGHHGSRTSTSELFLDEVAPQFAVISAAADNSYGHPHVEVTDALFNAGVDMFETAKQGTVTFLSDGESVWVE